MIYMTVLSVSKNVGNYNGLQIDFDLSEVIGGETYQSSQSQNSSKEPHPDLAEKFVNMAPMVAQIMGFTMAKEVVNKKEFKADVLQKDLISRYVDEITGKIRVTGISISGKEDNKGVVITSSFAVDNNQRIALNSPRIMFKSSSRGFEEKLQDLVEGIEEEAYEFVYNRKVANPEMFDYE